MLNPQKDKYVILELIPTRSDPKYGIIAQISALKLNGIKLEDRFDYRVEDKFVDNEYVLGMIQYDKEMFTYVNNIYFMFEKFKHWVKDYPIYIVEEDYTLKYLKDLKNKKELVFNYLDLKNGPDVITRLKEKYKLQPSFHIVDLIYEAIIYEGNNKK